MYKLAVVGNPIAHSLSPVIFAEFAKETGIPLDYQRICAPIDEFESIVKKFFESGGHALNITAPFKARAYAMANKHLEHTIIPQTANVLIYSNKLLLADNTDGLGLVADLKRSSISLEAKNILILGSGSVIFSVLRSLELERPARIDLLMRNMDKLEDFMIKSPLVDEYQPELAYDLIINTTPNTPDNQLFSQVKMLNQNACAYDMIYTANKTIFMQQMEKINPKIIMLNGLGMLIQQAKFGFQRMFGIEPVVDGLYPLLQGIINA
jgi:shikimate dehydrogenase